MEAPILNQQGRRSHCALQQAPFVSNSDDLRPMPRTGRPGVAKAERAGADVTAVAGPNGEDGDTKTGRTRWVDIPRQFTREPSEFLSRRDKTREDRVWTGDRGGPLAALEETWDEAAASATWSRDLVAATHTGRPRPTTTTTWRPRHASAPSAPVCRLLVECCAGCAMTSPTWATSPTPM